MSKFPIMGLTLLHHKLWLISSDYYPKSAFVLYDVLHFLNAVYIHISYCIMSHHKMQDHFKKNPACPSRQSG